MCRSTWSIGVPTFAFKDTLDPIALQQNLAQLSQYFQTDTGGRNSPLASQFQQCHHVAAD